MFAAVLSVAILFLSGSLFASEPPPASHNSEPGNVTAPAHAAHWDYSDTSKWNESSQICGTGKRQSPIDIATRSAVGDWSLAGDRLLFGKYSSAISGDFFNNGHTVQFTLSKTIEADKRPRIYGGGLGAKGFILEQFHFHWGSCSFGQAICTGSEHTTDGRSFPAEIHFVHYNSKYQSLSEAAGNEDGLAVIGFLFELVNDPNLVKTDYTQITNLIANISEVNNKTSVQFDLSKLVPVSAATGAAIYYRYDGSLTTPPCSEVVTWTVYEDRIPILASALNDFQDAMTKFSNGTFEIDLSLVNNFRPVQALNGRVVKTNRVPITTTVVPTTLAPTTVPASTPPSNMPAAAPVAAVQTTPKGSASINGKTFGDIITTVLLTLLLSAIFN